MVVVVVFNWSATALNKIGIFLNKEMEQNALCLITQYASLAPNFKGNLLDFL